ncbi:hypothetical protein CGRA01v4_00782 [Colletotrichum graminicola]|nr:hypothetical protein CGRA01v4_00782 [Colletotrichum graminicola]
MCELYQVESIKAGARLRTNGALSHRMYANGRPRSENEMVGRGGGREGGEVVIVSHFARRENRDGSDL